MKTITYVSQFWGNRNCWVDSCESIEMETALSDFLRSRATYRRLIERELNEEVLKKTDKQPPIK